HDLLPLLDAELRRLPDKYRAPLVLCDLEGQTRSEAALHLGWPQGTVATRLARARLLLARRLRPRGLVLGTAALTLPPRQNAAAALPASLTLATVRAAVEFGTVGGALSPVAVALAEGVLRAMLLNKLQLVFALVLLVAGALLAAAARPAVQAGDRGE